MANQYYVPLAQNAAQPGTTVRSSQFNENNNAIETGFELLPSPLSLFSGTTNFAISTGATPNQYLISINPELITSYGDGLTIQFRAHQANSGSVQVNVNSIGLREVRTRSSLQLNTGDILDGSIVVIRYNANTGMFNVDDAITEINAFVQEAEAARDLAQQWATNPEDDPVTPGNFSALHHAIKAAASASAAANSAINSGNSATAAAGSANTATLRATAADQSATDAGTSETNAANSATTAWQQAQSATNSATTASQQASAANTSRQQAQSAASTATTQAGDAQSSAGAASSSATAAAGSETAAGNSQQAAATSATNASNSANTATEQAVRSEAGAERAEIAAGIAEDAVSGTTWTAVDGDTTSVNIEKSDVLRYQPGPGMQINFTDTNGGTPADPFDLQFSVTDAPALRTARTISLSGDASGSTDFDGSQNVILTVTVANNSHSHLISNVSGLQTVLDGLVENFTIEDGDGTAVTMVNASRVKFLEGTGIDINFTDTTPGTPVDPFDLQFNVTSAPQLTTARTIALTGDITGSGSFDGSSNLSINTIADFLQFFWGNGSHKLFSNDGSGNSGISFGADGNTATESGRPWRIVASNDNDNGGLVIQRSSTSVSAGGAITWVDDVTIDSNGNVAFPSGVGISSVTGLQSELDSKVESFSIQDGDSTVVTMGDGNRIRFQEGGGIRINLTDTDNGTPADPFDLQFAVINASESFIGGGRFGNATEVAQATSTTLLISPRRLLDSINNAGGIREALQDLVGSLAEGGNTNITVTYDDAAAELTFAVPNSSSTVRGVSELATNAEAAAGTDTARVITPAGLRFAVLNGTIRSDLNAVAVAAIPTTLNAVKTYAMVRYTGGSNVNPGTTVAGSQLRYASAGGAAVTSPTPSGTWRIMGIVNVLNDESRTTIAVRVS